MRARLVCFPRRQLGSRRPWPTPQGRPEPRLRRAVVAATLLSLLFAGCGAPAGPPSPTPADFPGIARLLDARWIRVSGVVAGDPGCSNPALARLAIAFDAQGLDQPSPLRLHAFLFADAAALERNRTAAEGCVAAGLPAGAPLVSLAVPPYLVAGPGPWPPRFRDALRGALEEAATLGG
jgi:hypothetical protein